jgi:cyclophilin family peptidyl-prolyl cis-trans isomerase/HEAT repeat protein
MLQRSLLLTFASFGSLILPLAAQDPAQVEALAPLLMAEDRRSFDPVVLAHGVNDPDPLVRGTAVLTIGRIGDHRGTQLLVPLLSDRDMGVVANTFFAFGLLRDTVAVDAVITRLRAPDSLSADAVGEAATALARIGGAGAARFIGAVLSGTTDMPIARQTLFVPNALVDGWRLGALMPAQAMLHFANDTSTDLRWRTVSTLGRLRIPTAGPVVLRGMRDPVPSLRETAARWLTRSFADTAGLAAVAAKTELARALNDDQPGVRINAVGSLATFNDSTVAGKIIQLLADGDPNVRVAAVSALGNARGSAATHALDLLLDRRDASWAMRRAALTALARADTAVFARRSATWLASGDFRDRIAALQAWGTLAAADAGVFRSALGDADARVQAAALEGWHSVDAMRRRSPSASGDTSLATAARTRLRAPDEHVRAAAADALRASVDRDDLDLLLAGWRQSVADPGSDARLAVLATMHALAGRQPDLLARLENPLQRDFLQRPDDPVVRAEAARSWPDLAERWGAPWPIDTHRTLDDYRSVVRLYLLAPDDLHVTIDVGGGGSIDVQLLGHEAPLTVANFLRLVDRHYFDGSRWHRVVPNFVLQDGDPTGTGNGGPGWSIRDEINRERYVMPMVGMALSGPDTGGSQWFINLSPQPHLDGQYTIFGKISGTFAPLARIVQGDVIRSIHR